MKTKTGTHLAPCCPELAPNDICDILDFHYRLTYPARAGDLTIPVEGNFDSNSVSSFLGEHSQHAENSFHAAEMGTRKASSVSIGETQSRTHTESESQDHYESASREFENKNKCHAVTFLFYQINKTQKV